MFKNLGLVIVDEEQRFGVAHKERLKQLRTQVDVLTLSATPIPRTMSMALSGLRDMSVIEDPPEGRTPVLTYVREYDDDLIRDAMLRELERDGQVYFVHNKIESIYHVAAASAAAGSRRAHRGRARADVGRRPGAGDVSTSTITSPIFWSAPRSSKTVWTSPTSTRSSSTTPTTWACRSCISCAGASGAPAGRRMPICSTAATSSLTEVAERRLAAMKEFSALGSGYKVAMRDLEIRGAGNLLGAEQHGAMISVGFDLYVQLLAQAVQELKGEEVTEDILPSVDLPVTAHIPDDYIPGEAERIYFYKRMSGVRSVAGHREPAGGTGRPLRRSAASGLGRAGDSAAASALQGGRVSPASRARARTSVSGSRPTSA